MKRTILLLALFLTGLSVAPVGSAAAADRTAIRQTSQQSWHMAGPRDGLPFPRSERAQSVWASGTCWSECGSYCAWGQTECLERDTQGQCIKLTDKCDRYCQRTCRTSGGPLLPIEMFWD